MSSPTDLSELFAKKGKKKIKGVNLNAGPSANKSDDKKSKTKDQEEEGWQEEQVVATSLKVEVAGNLTRHDDKKEDEGEQKAAWGAARKQVIPRDEKDERKFPTLKGPKSTINIGPEEGKINIAVSKNAYGALENDDDDDSDTETKKPTKIVPAMVQKKRGETEKSAVQREVAKYAGVEKKKQKKKNKDDSEDESVEDDDEDEEEEENEEEKSRAAAAKAEAALARKKEKDAKKAAAKKFPAEKEEEYEDVEDDCKILVNLGASKAKYEGRKKPFAPGSIPREEREEVKAAKPAAKGNAGGGGKKKKVLVMEEDDKKAKLQYLEE